MRKNIRDGRSILVLAAIVATMGLYCWDHILPMLDKVVVGGGLTFTSVYLLAASLAIMLAEEKPARIITSSARRQRPRL